MEQLSDIVSIMRKTLTYDELYDLSTLCSGHFINYLSPIMRRTTDVDEIRTLLQESESKKADDLYKAYLVTESLFNQVIPPLEMSITVYRGLEVDSVESIDFNPSNYIFTSIDRDIASTYAGSSCCILRITVSPGSVVIPIYPFCFTNERAVVLNRGGQLVVTNVAEEQRNLNYPGLGVMTVVDVTYLPRGSVDLRSLT